MQVDVVHDLTGVSDKLGQLAAGLDDLTPVMQAIGAVVEGSTRERFSTKTAPDGSSWADLKPSTLEAKNGRGGILVDRGDLMRSITTFASSTSVSVGTDRPYAKHHQTGTPNMEQREIFGLSSDDVTDIQALLNDFMSDLL